MKPSGFYTYTLAANASINLPVTGDYFKVMSATGAVTVKSNFGTLDDLIAGQGLENTPFLFLTIINKTASANTVRIFVGDENFIDGISGSLSVTKTVMPTGGSHANTQATVTNVAALFDAANPSRQYLLIQNNHATGILYLGFYAGVTAANGIKVVPGGFWEPACVPTGAIYAIGDIASNASIVMVEA
jgi:hypothetical protein